jgi:hypothetical protein
MPAPPARKPAPTVDARLPAAPTPPPLSPSGSEPPAISRPISTFDEESFSHRGVTHRVFCKEGSFASMSARRSCWSATPPARRSAPQLAEAGYRDIRQEVLDLDPVPAVSVLATAGSARDWRHTALLVRENRRQKRGPDARPGIARRPRPFVPA